MCIFLHFIHAMGPILWSPISTSHIMQFCTSFIININIVEYWHKVDSHTLFIIHFQLGPTTWLHIFPTSSSFYEGIHAYIYTTYSHRTYPHPSHMYTDIHHINIWAILHHIYIYIYTIIINLLMSSQDIHTYIHAPILTILYAS